MFIRQISLTWLLIGTVSLLFLLYMIAAFIAPRSIAFKSYDHLNQVIDLHKSIQQGYAQLTSKAISIRRMVEANILKDRVSEDDLTESSSWLDQSVSQIDVNFNALAEFSLPKPVAPKMRYLLLMSKDVGSDDHLVVEQEIKTLLLQQQQQFFQAVDLLSKKGVDKSLIAKLKQDIKVFNINYDQTLTIMEAYFNQPGDYQELVTQMLIEQNHNLDELGHFLHNSSYGEKIAITELQKLHKQIRFFTSLFYNYSEEPDMQSDTFIILVEQMKLSWEQYETMLSQQMAQVSEIIHESSNNFSAELNQQGKQVTRLMKMGMIVAIMALSFFLIISYRRLNALRLTSLMIAEGEQNPPALPSGGHDFVAQIENAFNLMIHSINQRDQQIQLYVNELSDHQEKLEEEVKQRTAELAFKNSQLSGEILLRERKEAQLRLSGLALANTSDAILITDEQNVILEVNPAFCQLTGYSREESLGQTPNFLKSNKHSDEFFRLMFKTLVQEDKWDGEIVNQHKSGKLFSVWESINAVRDEEKQLRNYVGVFRDISKLKQTEKELHNLAYYDHLTHLPNRTLFYEHLEREIAISQRDGTKLAVLFIDLDRFKYVNDTLGHDAGDQLLVEVGQRLQKTVWKTDIVARQGGDEFLILLRKIKETDNVAKVAGKIIHQLQLQFIIAVTEVQIGGSIGISIFPDDGYNVDLLIKNSDIAMYHAKEKGRGNYQFFDEFMNTRNIERIKIEQRLSLAIEKGDLELHYQSQINHHGQICGAEALVRWHDAELGMVSPDTFIPIAEENGLIHLIGAQVVDMVCQNLQHWQNQSIVDFIIAINLSPKELLQPQFTENLIAKVQKYGLKPQDLELEITETAILENIVEAKAVITQLSQAGFTMALDDFGTGYSSLSYLHQLPFDKLKIDRSFINDIPDSQSSITIAKAIISLAKSMQMSVIAEGVENKEQQQFLFDNDCDYCQGYGISKPLPMDNFIEFVLQHDN